MAFAIMDMIPAPIRGAAVLLVLVDHGTVCSVARVRHGTMVAVQPLMTRGPVGASLTTCHGTAEAAAVVGVLAARGTVAVVVTASHGRAHTDRPR